MFIDNITIPLSFYQLLGGILFLALVSFLLLWNNIPQKLSKGWHALSDLNEKALTTLKSDLDKALNSLKERDVVIIDLIREVDVRKEINSQDTQQINQLKKDIQGLENTMAILRRELREETEK